MGSPKNTHSLEAYLGKTCGIPYQPPSHQYTRIH